MEKEECDGVAAKAKEGFAKAKVGLQKTWEQQKQKQKAKPKKEKSFFSKALKWTKELAADIQTEMEKESVTVASQEGSQEGGKEGVSIPEEAVVPSDTDAKPLPPSEAKSVPYEEAKPLPSEEAEPETLIPADAELAKGDLVSAAALKKAEFETFSVDEVKTSSGIDGGKEYCVLCGKSALLLAKSVGATKWTIADSSPIESLSKMTKKKDDPSVVTLTFDKGDDGLCVWRLRLSESLQLCSSVTGLLNALNCCVFSTHFVQNEVAFIE